MCTGKMLSHKTAFFLTTFLSVLIENTQCRAVKYENQQDDSIQVNSIEQNTENSQTNSETEVDPITLAGLFEGDIAGINITEPMARNVVFEQNTWPNGEIPYYIDESFGFLDKLIISEAIIEFHSKSCIRFKPWQNDADYVKIVKGKGCSSDVGKKGGVQKVTLGEGCVKKGIVMHEFLHTTGFWHEQSREDRDDYVDILWENIKPENVHNFNKYSWSVTQSLDEKYDTGSLMHYGEFSFAKTPKKPTIRSKQLFSPKMGQRIGFSTIDLNKLNKLYSCSTMRKLNDDPSNAIAK